MRFVGQNRRACSLFCFIQYIFSYALLLLFVLISIEKFIWGYEKIRVVKSGERKVHHHDQCLCIVLLTYEPLYTIVLVPLDIFLFLKLEGLLKIWLNWKLKIKPPERGDDRHHRGRARTVPSIVLLAVETEVGIELIPKGIVVEGTITITYELYSKSLGI